VPALLRLIDDPALRRHLGQAGRRQVLVHHDLRRTGEVLLECLTGQPDPRPDGTGHRL
jgi:hypothetical protein